MFGLFKKKKPEVVESEQATATDLDIQETLRRNREALEDREQCGDARRTEVAGISQLVSDETQKTVDVLDEKQLAEWNAWKDGLQPG